MSHLYFKFFEYSFIVNVVSSAGSFFVSYGLPSYDVENLLMIFNSTWMYCGFGFLLVS